jgi:GT2 family glycosyltransferase
MNNLSIVIPVRDDLKIRRCLESIDDARAEPLVVLNRATNVVRDIVRKSGVSFIELGDAGGPRACEKGIWEAKHDNVLLMDSDCVFRKGTIEKFIHSIGEAPFVRGRVVFAHYTRPQSIVAAVRTIHTNATSIVGKVPLMLNREVVSKVGGYFFDSRLSWTEDYDLTQRIRAAGLPVKNIHEAIIVHEPLSFYRDLLSSYSYGKGHFEGEHLGLAGYGQLRINLSKTRLSSYSNLYHKAGIAVAIYAFIFHSVMVYSYQKSRRMERKPRV